VHDLKCHFAHGEAELREDATAAEECEGNDVATTNEFRTAGRKGKGKKDYAAWASAGAWKESQAKEAKEGGGEGGGGGGAEKATKEGGGGEGGSKAKEARPRRLMLQPRTVGLAGGNSIQAVCLSSGAGKEPVKPDGGKGFTRGRGKPVAGPRLPQALLAPAPGSAPAACAGGEKEGHEEC